MQIANHVSDLVRCHHIKVCNFITYQAIACGCALFQAKMLDRVALAVDHATAAFPVHYARAAASNQVIIQDVIGCKDESIRAV
jgi:hypothetical protein